jgi:hypothetical protein
VKQVTARLRELREYRWSSYRRYGGYAKGPTWLRSEELLKRSKGTSKDWQRHYRAQVKEILSRGVEESRIESFRDSVGIGSEQFKDMLRHIAGEGLRETERRGRQRERVSFDRVIDAVSEVRGSPADGSFSQYGDTEEWMVMALARRFCGMTLSELGSATGGRDYVAVSVGLKRFEKRMVTDKLLQKEYMTLTEMLRMFRRDPQIPRVRNASEIACRCCLIAGSSRLFRLDPHHPASYHSTHDDRKENACPTSRGCRRRNDLLP